MFNHHFPALTARPNGQRLAFLDSAASAQKPTQVIDALTATLSGPYANIHRGLYFNAAQTTQAYEDARAQIARFFHTNANQVVFTRNSTEAINLVAGSWGGAHLKPSSIVTVTEIEHHANLIPWQMLQQHIGFILKVIPMAALVEGHDLTRYLAGATLLAITQMSNVTGFAPNLAHIIPLAKKQGAAVLVDGSQGAVHAPQNLETLGADFYAATGHKLYGPTGVGVLWARAGLMETMPPYQGGGDMIEEVILPAGTTFAPPPARFEAGTPAFAEAVALAQATRFIETVGWAKITDHEHTLARALSAQLAALPFLTRYSPENSPIQAFNVQGCHPADVATLLDQQGVAVRSGHHCAMPYMKALQIGPEYGMGCLRASLALYNTEDDLAQLTAALSKAHTLLAR